MLKPKKELIGLNIYETDLYPKKWDMKLDCNENYIGPSTAVLNAIKNLEPEQISHYPYYGILYDVLAHNFEVASSNIALTNGADEALSAVINTYISKDDAILTVKPSFAMPGIYAQTTGAKYIEIPYKTKWVYPFEEIIKSVSDEVKMILITTPNNPTGDIVPLEQIVELLEKFPDKAVVIDETYSSFAGISNICLTEKYNNAIVIKSFSKDYGLAGLRFGCIVSDKNNIDNIKRVLSPYNVNSVVVKAGVAALNDENYLNMIRNEVTRSKMLLSEELINLGFKPYLSHANFLLVDFGGKCGLIYEKLKSNNIIVKSFAKNETLKNCLRITVPTFSAVQRIINLIKSRDTLVFDMDGVLVDVSSSYYEAIKHTYKHFTGKELSSEDINNAKKLGGLNNDWDLTRHLIQQYGFKFSYDDIVNVFQKHYWDDGEGSINNEDILIDATILEDLSKKYNLAVFTGRPREEAYYTLNKFGISKYFQKIVTMTDLPSDKQKPNCEGLRLIKKDLITDEIIYFGDTVDDAKCAVSFGAYGVGVLPPNDKSRELIKLLYDSGAKVVISSINDVYDVLEKKADERVPN